MRRRDFLSRFAKISFLALTVGSCARTSTQPAPARVAHFLQVPTLTTVLISRQDEKIRPQRLIIMLHGYGGRPESMLELVDGLDDPQTVWAAPHGTQTAGLGYSWFVLGSDPQLVAASDASALEQLSLTIADLRQSIQPQQVVLLGHSQGAALAYLAAAAQPASVDALIVFGAAPPSRIVPNGELVSLKNKAIFIAHGRNDQVFSFASSVDAAESLRRAGASVHFAPFEGGHEVDTTSLRRAHEWLHEVLR